MIARKVIEDCGIRVVENIQLARAYWLPLSRVLVVPPGMSATEWDTASETVLRYRRHGEP